MSDNLNNIEMTDKEIDEKMQEFFRMRDEFFRARNNSSSRNALNYSTIAKMFAGIIGFTVGDALGVPVEFLSRDKLTQYPIKEMFGYGSHYVPEGTWSDDTSMMLATMDSIIEKKSLDYEDIMIKFCEWSYSSKYTATGIKFDIGKTTNEALIMYGYGVPAIKCGGNEISDNGNGSLMRILPIVYYLASNNLSESEEVEIINSASSLTHAHEISCLGCKIYSDYIKKLLDGVDKKEALDFIKSRDYSKYYSEDSVREYKRILVDDISMISKDEIISSSYVVSTLEACLWSTLNSNNYEDAVTTAVNLGKDTDTIGAITGAINGIIYGKRNIPDRWIRDLKNKEYLYDLTDKFTDTLRDISRESKKESSSELNDMFQEEPVIISSEVVDNTSHK